MGEARRKKLEATILARQVEMSVRRVSMVVRKLATAASAHLGNDCYVHAELGCVLLADLGIEASPVLGFAAWRVGEGDGDVISHAPHTQGFLPPGLQGFAYHAWLDCFGFVIDFTTYQLRRKARELDAADGGHTTVSWCPEYLLLSRNEIRTYKEVAAALHPGVAHYEARPELETVLGSQYALDPEDLQAARLLLANPGMIVFGPNDVPTTPDS